MNDHEKLVYKEYLVEEERFLKEMERNLQEHLNRLKVEELTLLKLISTASENRDIEQEANEADGAAQSKIEDNNDIDFSAIPSTQEDISANNEDFVNKVNAIPLDLTTTSNDVVADDVLNVEKSVDSKVVIGAEELEEQDVAFDNDELKVNAIPLNLEVSTISNTLVDNVSENVDKSVDGNLDDPKFEEEEDEEEEDVVK